MNALSFILIFCVLVQDPRTASSSWIPQAQATPQAPADLMETDARKVAYIEHSGPYWSLGPVIDKVARDARAMGIRDNLFVRYLDDPVADSPGALRTEVGFELSGTDLPKAPYKVAHWPIALVARKTVTGPDGLSTRHFTSLKAWARSQDLAPAGDLIAVIKLAEGGQSTTIESAEILLPVCVPEPPAAKTAPAVLKSSQGEPPQFNATASRPTPRNITKVIQLNVSDEQGDGPEQNHADSARIALGSPVQQPTDRQLDAPYANSAAPIAPSLPVRQWIDDGRFIDVARAVLPENLESASQQWADQVASRIIALSNGVQKLFPGEEGWLAELSTQLAERRTASRAVSSKGTPRVIGPSAAIGRKDADRKALMQELDRLLANLSNRALKPDQVREILTQLLDRVPALVLP